LTIVIGYPILYLKYKRISALYYVITPKVTVPSDRCEHQQIIIPSYTTLQDLFSRAFAVEEKRLSAVIASISASLTDELSALIHREDGITALNIIRSDQKDFQYTAVHEIDRGRLYCNDSVSYCDIDTDLVDDALVDDAEKMAAEFGYPKIPVYCDQRLDEARQDLNDAWARTLMNLPGFRRLPGHIRCSPGDTVSGKTTEK
jgi:hypothetical protein